MRTDFLKIGARPVLICTLLWCSFFAPSLSFAVVAGDTSKNEIMAIGTARIYKGNLASAKNRAISQALVKGVESYLVIRLGSQNIANNFGRVIQKILPTAEEDIENFNILAEDRVGDEYKVLIRLTINEKLIDKRLSEAGLTVTEGPPIRLLFMVSETIQGITSYWWKEPERYYALSPTELALHNAFQKRGFSPINRTLNMPEAEFPVDLRVVDLEDSDILKWGRMFSADVVIFGRTELFEKNRLALSLKAFDVNRDVQIVQDRQIETVEEGFEGREAMIKALENLADQLAERFTPALIRMTEVGRDYVQKLEITLMGLKDYRQYITFTDFLKKLVPGVQSVKQIRVRKSSISIEVEFQGGRYQFLDSVLNHESLPFPVNLAETEEGNILLKVEPDLL